jgi:hypothetical protein
LLVCCGVWYVFFDNVVDVGYIYICMYRLVVYIPGCIRYNSKYF